MASNKVNVFGNSSNLVSKYLEDIAKHYPALGIHEDGEKGQRDFETRLGMGAAGYDVDNEGLYPLQKQSYESDSLHFQLLINIANILGLHPIGVTIGDQIAEIQDKLNSSISGQDLLKIMSSITGAGVYNNGINGLPIMIKDYDRGISFIIQSIRGIASFIGTIYQIRELGNVSIKLDLSQYLNSQPTDRITFRYYSVINNDGNNMLRWLETFSEDQINDITSENQNTDIDYNIMPYGVVPTDWTPADEGMGFKWFAGGIVIKNMTSEQNKMYVDLLREGSIIPLYDYIIYMNTGNISPISFEAVQLFEPRPSASQQLEQILGTMKGNGTPVIVKKEDVDITINPVPEPIYIPAGNMVGPFNKNLNPYNKYIVADGRTFEQVAIDHPTFNIQPLTNRLLGSRLPDTRIFGNISDNIVYPTLIMDEEYTRVWKVKVRQSIGGQYSRKVLITRFAENGLQINVDMVDDINLISILGNVKSNNQVTMVSTGTANDIIASSFNLGIGGNDLSKYLPYDNKHTVNPVMLDDFRALRTIHSLSNGDKVPHDPKIKMAHKEYITPEVIITLENDFIIGDGGAKNGIVKIRNMNTSNEDYNDMEVYLEITFIPKSQDWFISTDFHCIGESWISYEDILIPQHLVEITR